MNKNSYLKSPGKECPLWSSAAVRQYCSAKGITLLQPPVPGVSARPEDEENTGFFVWNVKSQRGTHVLPFFKYEELAKKYEMMTFRPLDEGEMFLYDGRLYLIKTDKRGGFYLQNVFLFYHQSYAEAEAAIRGFVGAEFMLCRIYVIGRVKKQLGICWVGWVPETGDVLFVKLFQDDIERFMAYDPLQLAREAIDIGETFYDHGRFWKLCKDEDDAYLIKEVKTLAEMSIYRR